MATDDLLNLTCPPNPPPSRQANAASQLYALFTDGHTLWLVTNWLRLNGTVGSSGSRAEKMQPNVHSGVCVSMVHPRRCEVAASRTDGRTVGVHQQHTDGRGERSPDSFLIPAASQMSRSKAQRSEWRQRTVSRTVAHLTHTWFYEREHILYASLSMKYWFGKNIRSIVRRAVLYDGVM